MKLDVAYKKWDKRYAKVSQLSAPICSTSIWDLVKSLLTSGSWTEEDPTIDGGFKNPRPPEFRRELAEAM